MPTPALALLLVLAAPADLPMVEAVEPQPLRAQLRRLAQALEVVGSPLPADLAGRLEALEDETDPTRLAAGVQQILDPLCLAAVELVRDEPPRLVTADEPPTLVEQGWRTVLIKVVNRAGLTGRLRVDSPNARPIPGGPASAVSARWLELDLFEGQPLKPDLGGLELEYRLLQIFARDRGTHEAPIAFHVGDGRRDNRLIRAWRFDDGPDGWRPTNQVELEARDGALHVRNTGDDPFMMADAPGPDGPMVLRFWAKPGRGGVGQVYWWTKDRPMPDGGHVVNFPMPSNRAMLYEVRFRSDGPLAGVRIDPGHGPDEVQFDWIELARAGPPGEDWPSAAFRFEVAPSAEVAFRVIDGDDDKALAAFEIRDDRGRVYPAPSKRLAPDFFFHPQVYRGDGETVRLPRGAYNVVCSRGPESIPEIKTFTVGDEPVEVVYRVERWIDTAKLGWWSGDHHIHAAGCLHYENPTQGVLPEDMIRHTIGEDLKVGCSLTWGPCFDYQKQFFSGSVADVSRYPYLLRYDVEVSGFGSHQSGHLNLIGLDEQMYPGGQSKDHWPTLGMNTLRWAKSQGAVCGPAHSAIGLTRFVDRVPGTEGRDGPDGLPTFAIPAYDGIGANEFIVQAAHEVPGPDGQPVPALDFISTMNTDRNAEWNMWYHVLNTGARIRASGETDFPCVSGDRVGMGRVYVQVDGKLDYERWLDGLKNGRSYVSDGKAHLLDLKAESIDDPDRTVALGANGSELKLDRPGRVRLTLRAAARLAGEPEAPIELIINGFPVAEQALKADGELHQITFEADLDRSSWLAVRLRPHAHTNPIFALVAGAPIRASRASAEWCLRGVDQCWSQKLPTYAASEREQAERDYEHARAHYRKIRDESPADR